MLQLMHLLAVRLSLACLNEDPPRRAVKLAVHRTYLMVRGVWRRYEKPISRSLLISESREIVLGDILNLHGDLELSVAWIGR